MKRSSIELDEKFASNPGSRFKETFHGEVQPDGIIVLVSDGFIDQQAEIESWQESTEIENIVARVDAGEVELLRQREGFFGDVVGLPKTYAEMVSMMYNAEENFKRLPLEVRAAFNNDLNQYIAQYGSDEFFKKLDSVFKKEDSVPAVDSIDQDEKKEG